MSLKFLGMAWTIRRDLPAIQRAKSAGRTNALGLGGTQGYVGVTLNAS